MKIFNRRIYLKNKSEIELIKESALIVGLTLAEVAKYIKPGVPSNYLDKIAEDFIRSHQAVPSFKGYNGFPASLCISINDVVVHGIPSRQVLQEGDIVSVDCGVYKNGYHGDYAYTFAVGEISEEKKLLVERTKKSLYKGINEAKKGNHIGDISHAIQSYVESFGYGVVRELVGHGIGKKMHEKPDIPNYGKKGKGELIVPGMVFCIEPMINLGTPRVSMDADNWTIRTLDRKPSAHFEHQIAITEEGTEVLSTYQYIEEVLAN
ncbi:MAG TPA: type I methionyl aminopeptidase [Bacteroidales bacterium]|jgi:methionyl aminopeptidase|nr:type I methionyl aminopeptidase [Bacteroidales bacterium]HOS57398.1 type I methionyl aminopeptidase [Bacteroidales bacterium]HRR03693.1 type I methionyl aminopeptidase [Bacteroidales bacterium]HRT13153.1 type I methionyl aminopeptidase [Bacteroidales bacterium]HXK74044.1 type I methionyl aminopeptidase [Bacteroidales bacterium]